MNPTAAPALARTTHEWHLAMQSPWGRSLALVAVLCAVAIVGLALWSVRRERRAGRRWAMVALRAGGALTALALFLQPAIQFEDVTRVPNHVAVLVDGSESMALAEKAGDLTRADRAARAVAAAAPDFERWRDRHRIDFFTFGAELAPATEGQLVAPGAATRATAPATRLREALAALKSRYEDRDMGGVIVLSDGIDNGHLGAADGGELDADARDFVAGLGAPVHTVWAGRAGLRDVAIARVLADDFAFARNVVKVEAVVRTVGAREAGWVGKKLTVSLRRDGQPVRSATVTVDASKPEQKVAFEFTPDRVGKYLYEVSVPVLDGEAIRENNARTFVLKVIREKIRVLLVAGRPSWDERFLRGLLKHDPNVDLISFFILRTPMDIENVSPDEMSLIPFPTEELFLEELRSFDVVFLQNFNYAPYGIGAYLGEIKRYVEEGGGLAMLGGDLSFTSGGYAHSPVADVLPVELLDERPPEQLVDLAPVRPRLTPEGRNHPIMQLRVGAADNQKRWDALPPLEGVNLVARARSGATTLATHPTQRGVDGRPMPVLAVSDIGKGRALALMSDSSWRWGFGAAAGATDESEDTRGRAYQRFWENAIRWLIKDPELRFVRVETDQTEYRRGDKVRVVVRVREPDYRPAKNAQVSLTLARVGAAAGEAITKTLKTDDEGEAELDVGALAPGGWRATAKRQGGSGPAAMNQDEEVFVVRAAGVELEDAEARDRQLRAVATASGGSFRTSDDAWDGMQFKEPRVVKVHRYRDLELWSTWGSLVLAAVFLSAEWALRRRWGHA